MTASEHIGMDVAMAAVGRHQPVSVEVAPASPTATALQVDRSNDSKVDRNSTGRGLTHR